MYYFTSDEHYGHRNIIKYCKRPFNDVDEMDEELIKRHNNVVSDKDTVIHAGDFSLAPNKIVTSKYLPRLNGKHIFLWGSHDKWLSNPLQIWDNKVYNQRIVVCHYAMRSWPASHYGSWHLYGHSHGKLPPFGKSWDIGVDNNNYFPVSFDEIEKIISNLK